MLMGWAYIANYTDISFCKERTEYRYVYINVCCTKKRFGRWFIAEHFGSGSAIMNDDAVVESNIAIIYCIDTDIHVMLYYCSENLFARGSSI